MNRQALLLASSLILGLVVGFVLRPVIDPPEEAPEIGEVRTESESHAPETTPRRTPTTSLASNGETNFPSFSGDTVDDLIGSVDLGQRPQGKGTFRGQVRTKSGEALPGVTITATTAYGEMPKWSKAKGTTEAQSLRRQLQNTIASFQWRKMTEVKVKTNDDGSYVMEGLPDLRYSLYARFDGYQISATQNQPSNPRPGATVDFTASWRPNVEFQITSADGTTPKKATVNLRRNANASDWGHSWDPKRNKVSIPVGHWFVDASVGDDKFMRTQIVEIDMVEGKSIDPIALSVQDQPGVQGKIILPRGIKASPRVYLFKDSMAAEVTPTMLRKPKIRVDAEQRKSYEFSFRDVEPGNYLLGASLDRKTLFVSKQIVVNSSLVQQDLEVSKFNEKTFVVIFVKDPQGKNLSDVQLSMSYSSSTMSMYGGGTKLKRADGAFLAFHHRAPDEKAEENVKYTISSTSRKYGLKGVTYDPQKTREITIKYEEVGTLNLTLNGYRPEEFKEEIVIRVEGHTFGFADNGGTSLDRLGKATIGPLQDSPDLKLNVRLGYTKTLIAQPLHVRPGEQSIEIAMPTLYTLDVEFANPESISRFYLSRKKEPRWNEYSKMGTKTSHRFTNIPAGKYKLTVNKGEDSHTQEISIPHPNTIMIQ